MTRIKLDDGMQEIVMKLGENNPGAMRALMSLMVEAADIDPDNAFGAFGPLLTLDQLGIYGTDIYILYNDKCGCDVRRLILLLRATQYGVLPPSKLLSLSKDQCGEVGITNAEWDRLEEWVPEVLPNFWRKCK